MLADRDLSLLVTESLLLASAEGSDWAFIVSLSKYQLQYLPT